MKQSDKVDSEIMRAGKIAALATLYLFSSFMVFRVFIPFVWEMGDLGKILAMLLLAGCILQFAWFAIICLRIAFPAGKKEETEVEDKTVH